MFGEVEEELQKEKELISNIVHGNIYLEGEKNSISFL